MNIPRQPFVGLALTAALGIVAGDFFPLAEFQWPIWAASLSTLALALLWKPQTTLSYALVALGFFVLHNFRTHNTIGLRLADELTERERVVNAVGFVTSEPKIAPNGFATFLFELESIDFGGKTEPTTAR